MAIGDPISQTIPAVNTPGTGYAEDINAFLTEVKTRLEARVPFSALLPSSDLNLDGKGLLNARYTNFALQSSGSGIPIGSWYYLGNEFYAVTAAGTIQVTAGGQLNFAAVAGIGGDYGGANPAQVRFVDATKQYDFYDNFGATEWGYVRALGFDVAGGSVSAVYARLLFAGASNQTYTLPPDDPASNRSVLTMGSDGTIDHDQAITNDILTSGSARVVHAARNMQIPTSGGQVLGGAWVYNAGGKWTTTSTTNIMEFPNVALDARCRITSITAVVERTGAGTASLGMWVATGGSPVQYETDATSAGTGVVTLTKTFATPYTMTFPGLAFALRVGLPNSGDEVLALWIGYDLP